MFEDFSFACASRQHLYYHPFPSMDDNVSPNSSRESTPCYENGYSGSGRRYPAASNSIAELSRHFDQHSLTARRPSIAREGTTPRARDHNQPHQAANSFSNRVCRQWQSVNRLQCSSTHLSRISALVEDMVQTSQPLYDPPHPNSRLDDSTSPSLSPDEQQSSGSSYFGFAPLSSSSASAIGGYGSVQHSQQPSHSYKIDKELRHSASRDGIGGNQRMVQKKIRMRKSSKSLSMGVGKRRE